MLASRLGVESQGPRTWDILTGIGTYKTWA